MSVLSQYKNKMCNYCLRIKELNRWYYTFNLALSAKYFIIVRLNAKGTIGKYINYNVNSMQKCSHKKNCPL